MLAHSAIEISALVNVMPWCTMVIDVDSKILCASHAIEAISGYHPDELYEKPLHILIPSDAPHPHFASLSVFAGDDISKPIKPLSDVPLLKKDGTVVRVSVERYIYSFGGKLRFGGVVRLLNRET